MDENEISQIEGLDNLVNLKELYLYDNQISQIDLKKFRDAHPEIEIIY